MRKLFTATLLAATLASQVAATPGFAAAFTADRATASQEAGTFVGARVRVSLDGSRRAPVRAGLVAGPAFRADRSDGSRSFRFGEGVEIGIAGNRPLALSIAGQPVTGRDAIGNRQRAGVSTLGWVGIGLGVVAVIIIGALVWCGEDNDCPPSE